MPQMHYAFGSFQPYATAGRSKSGGAMQLRPGASGALPGQTPTTTTPWGAGTSALLSMGEAGKERYQKQQQLRSRSQSFSQSASTPASTGYNPDEDRGGEGEEAAPSEVGYATLEKRANPMTAMPLSRLGAFNNNAAFSNVAASPSTIPINPTRYPAA